MTSTAHPIDLTPGHRRLTDVCVEVIPPQGYRSPAWHKARMASVSASEIPAILGLSPYQSKFDLWWAKRNGEHGKEDNQQMRRGRRVEPLVIEDFGEEHPEFDVGRVGLVANVLRQWQVATPDGLVYESHLEQMRRWREGEDYRTCPVAVLEAKTVANGDGWGEPGTDQIPVHYRAQVMWQMDVTGLDVAFVAAWIGYTYKEYVVSYDRADAEFMRDEARAFLASLEEGIPPEVDAHPATTARLKAMHPTVQPGDVEVPPAIIAQHRAAKRLMDAAKARVDLAENRLRSLMGDKAVAKVDGRKVAGRSVYDVPESLVHRKAYTVNKLTVTKQRGSK